MIIMKNVKLSWWFLGWQLLSQTVNNFSLGIVPNWSPSSVLLRAQLILNVLCLVPCLVFQLSTASTKLFIFLLFDSETKPRNCKGETLWPAERVTESACWSKAKCEWFGTGRYSALTLQLLDKGGGTIINRMVCSGEACSDLEVPGRLSSGATGGKRGPGTQNLDAEAIALLTPGPHAHPKVPGCASEFGQRRAGQPHLPAASSLLAALCLGTTPPASLSHSLRVQDGQTPGLILLFNQ